MDDEPRFDVLVEPALAARLARARAGSAAETGRRLFIGALEPGDFGVLTVDVRAVSPVRPYQRKAGGEGLLARVTLADATGEVDLVLWDDEARSLKDGPFQPGRQLLLRGATVKRGHRGGIELSLGAAVVTRVADADASGTPAGKSSTLEGLLVAIGDARPIGQPPAVRFQIEARILVHGGGGVGREVNILAWDNAVKALRAIPLATRVRLAGLTPNPLLPGWYTAQGDCEISLVALPNG